jgi:replicative DNA helicase
MVVSGFHNKYVLCLGRDTDVVMFLYREDAEDLSSVKLNIAKHRNGALRTIDLRFKGDRVRFYGVDKAH